MAVAYAVISVAFLLGVICWIPFAMRDIAETKQLTKEIEENTKRIKAETELIRARRR